MVTISLCMIVKNEEAVLSRCLESIASLVDEIILVDTGSTDATKEIAAKYTSNIYSFPWKDDFAAARNFSFSKAAMDYCMWMDADDLLEPSFREEFLRLKEALSPDINMVMMKYNTAFDEAGNPIFSYYRERWIKNAGKPLWEGEVHEVITPFGNILRSDIAVSHKKLGKGDPDRNLNIYKKMLAQHKPLAPRQAYYYGRELYYHASYEEAAAVFTQFIRSSEGWLENKIEACKVCADCYFQMDQDELALGILLRSLEFDVPRAELCCDIGKYFFNRKKYRIAIFWYETALQAERDDERGGFILPDCYNYIPLMQLCVCYDSLGDRRKAAQYNDKAGHYKPDSPAFLQNKRYFETINN